MPIIYTSNTEALAATLAEANGKVTRTVNVSDVLAAVLYAEGDLAVFGIRKADWNRVTVTVNPNRNRQPTAKSYSYSAQATEVVLGRNSKGWFIVSAGTRRALSDTIANNRPYFLNIPAEVIKVEKVYEALGFVIV